MLLSSAAFLTTIKGHTRLSVGVCKVKIVDFESLKRAIQKVFSGK
jgi:hypothetical protein